MRKQKQKKQRLAITNKILQKTHKKEKKTTKTENTKSTTKRIQRKSFLLKKKISK